MQTELASKTVSVPGSQGWLVQLDPVLQVSLHHDTGFLSMSGKLVSLRSMWH